MIEVTTDTIRELRNDPIYKKLLEVFPGGSEGNLLDITEESTAVNQIGVILKYLEKAKKPDKPLKVLETGTNKGMFTFLLSKNGGGTIYTHDLDPRTQLTADAIPGLMPNIDFHYTLGNTIATLGKYFIEDEFDFAWVDGGHYYDVALSDIFHCGRLKIPYILVDDCKYEMVSLAIRTFLETHDDYREIPNESYRDDPRGIRILTLSGIN
jgi:hypothetical protein